MSWTRLDDGFDANAKLLALGTGVRGDARRWTWTRVLLYTSRQGGPGVPWALGEVVHSANKRFLRECVALMLLDQDDDGSLEVHDWLLYADVPVSEKVAYLMAKDPDASANHIVREVGAKRTLVLHEITRQKCVLEPNQVVPGNHLNEIREPPTPVPENEFGNHLPGSESGSRARAPVPELKNEEETKSVSSSRTLATLDDAPLAEFASAQTLTGWFVDESRTLGVQPPARVTGQVARLVGELLAEQIPAGQVHAGLRLLLERRLHPSTLPSLVHEAGLPARTHSRPGRVSPSELMAHAKQLREQEETMFRDAI